MTSKKQYFADLVANDELTFDFPYDGGSIATLILRKKRGENNVILKISKGRFIHNYEGGSIKVRFGIQKLGFLLFISHRIIVPMLFL